MAATLALCSMACAASNDLVFKQRAAAGTPPARHLALVAAVWMACFIVPACAGAWGPGDPALAWGLISGVLGIAANLLFLTALGGGEVGSCATIYRLNLVPATLLAVVLLGEDLTPRRALAVSAALGAVAVLAGARRGGSWRWLLLAGIACLARAGMGLAYKHGLTLGADSSRLLFVNGAVWLAGSLLWLRLAPGAAPAWRGSDLGWGLLSGLLISGNVLFLTLALARAPLADVLPITQLGFVATAVVAIPLYREPPTVRKLAAIALAIACILSLGAP